jgi:hypothetical protein
LAVDGQRQLVVVSFTFVQADGRRNTKPPMQQSPETLYATLKHPANLKLYRFEQTFLKLMDNNRHCFERQTQEKKIKKNANAQKNSIANAQNTLSFFLQTHEANPQKK